MREILLSMQPFWFDKVMSSEKIYEYRNRFPNEEIKAYIYVSSPVQAIAGILYLDRRIEVNSWKENYYADKGVIERIDMRKDRNKYAMPISSLQSIENITINMMSKKVKKFIIPESYYYLNNYPEIREAIYYYEKQIGNPVKNDRDRFSDSREICRNYR